MHNQPVQVIVVMGVSGSGKTTIGELLQEQLGWPFHDGDAFHPARNVAKMRSGLPLTDEDRQPWLAAMRHFLDQTLKDGTRAILATSALKAAYRSQLLVDDPRLLWIYLKGSYEEVLPRIAARTGHYMKAGMLKSQFDTLEVPSDGIHAIPITYSPEEIVRQIIRKVAD